MSRQQRLLFGGPHPHPYVPVEQPARRSPATSMASLQELGGQFRQLRQLRGHFDGQEWNADVDKFEGAKHNVMRQLETHFKNGEHAVVDLAGAMGPPDEVARTPDDFPRNQANLPVDVTDAVRQAGGPVYLGYHWRGRHDILWFKTDGSKVQDAGWWMALD